VSTKEQSIKFWRDHYLWCKEDLERIDRGEPVQGRRSLVGSEIGIRTHLINEVNEAVTELEKLDYFELKKIQ